MVKERTKLSNTQKRILVDFIDAQRLDLFAKTEPFEVRIKTLEHSEFTDDRVHIASDLSYLKKLC